MLRKPILAALLATTVAGAVLAEGSAAFSRVPTVDAAVAAEPRARANEEALAPDRIQIKFRDAGQIRLRNGRLVSLGDVDMAALTALIGRHPRLRIEPLFAAAEAELDRHVAAAERTSGKQLVDFNSWYRLRVPDGVDRDALLAALRALPMVESAEAELLPAPQPAGDLTGYQGYKLAAPSGINAAAAAGLPGGTGDRVKIIDIEYSWNTTHEDLGRAANGLIRNGTPVDPFNDTNHGTAVLGELIAAANGFGVTGIAPGAAIGMVNASNAERGYDLHNAIYLAANSLSAGDVILLEQQLDLQRKANDYIPVEYSQVNFDAIRYATSRGIIVVEAAGNGSNDLDAIGIGRSDSGAILVGAGEAPNCGTGAPRGRVTWADGSSSNYGSRIDVQAWGECVTTTGYGAASTPYNSWYTHTFGGTSSASPIVTGAAALLSSVIEARTGAAATPAQIRTLLKATGTPQATGAGALAGNIGPLPDVAAALARLGTSTTSDTVAPVVNGPSNAIASGYPISSTSAVPTTISWSATDASGIAAYAVKVSTNGAAWADLKLATATTRSLVLDLVPGTRYQFTVAARDGAGNWSSWKTGPVISPTLIAENHAAVRWSTGWARTAYAPALGGAVTVSGTKGAWTSLSFTGRGIAWVGTRATNRGQADVWLDGVYQGRFDLYRSSTLARSILFSKSVSTGVTHKLDIQVVGTLNRPKIDVDAFAILK